MSKKKLAGIIVACAIVIIVAIVLFSIKPWERTYTLSVSVYPPEAGSVYPSSGEYESGLQVTLTATPASGYTFDYWAIAASGSSNIVNITMNSNKIIHAYFEVVEPSAQEIVEGVIESMDEIRTYRFDVDMTSGIAAEAEGEVVEMTMVMDLNGVLDLEDRQMKIDMTAKVEGLPEPDETETRMEIYLVGDMIYTMMDVPGIEPMWTKMEMQEGYWDEMNQVESQIELLEAAQVEVIGSETIEDTDCYVLQITPDMGQLLQFAIQQGALSEEEVPDVAEELLQEMFTNFSVKQWISKDTYFLIKAAIDMGLELEVSLPIDISVVLLCYDYNQPVSIELPPEAEEAIEVPIQ